MQMFAKCNMPSRLLYYYLALHSNVCICSVCKHAAEVAASLVVCWWCAACACRDLCLHVLWLGDSKVVLYHAIKQGSTAPMHASLMKLLLMADPKHKSELDSSCSCSYTESSINIKVTSMLLTPTFCSYTKSSNNIKVTSILRTSTSLQCGCSSSQERCWAFAGGSDKADFYEHAVKLGAGPEALAGFAEGAVGVGRAGAGGVYAAARRIVQAQPYSPAAYTVLGLACEARGDFEGAVKAYTDGLDVRTDNEAGERLQNLLSVLRALSRRTLKAWMPD